MPNMVHWTHPAGVVPHLGREEAEVRHQYYIGPEHLLVGLLRQGEFLRQVDSLGRGDDAAADLLVAHGLDLATVRAGIDRLVAQGVLPRPSSATASCWPPSGSTWTRSTTASRRSSAGRPGTTPPSGCDCGRSSRFPMHPGAGRRSPAIGCSCWPARRRSPAAPRSGPCTCCSGCSATPSDRSPKGSAPESSGCAPCSASPTPARARSGSWSRRRD